jgi:CDP-diacylglycerol--serine O-phosphatidyltransferase
MESERKTRRARARAIVRARLEKLEELSVSKLVPSFLTLLGMCSGLTAIRFAMDEAWTLAVAAVVCAGIFDMLDGRAARILGADSRFGAQLDSLADIVSFGIAPAIIMFKWSLWQMGILGWIIALVFCAASATRLARFNVQAARDEGATNVHPYFTGLPTPAAAFMVLSPLLLSFQWSDPLIQAPAIAAIILVVIASLMVSTLPMPSLKYLRLPRHLRWLTWLAAAGSLACLAIWPWATLTAALATYIATIPLAILTHRPRRIKAAS